MGTGMVAATGGRRQSPPQPIWCCYGSVCRTAQSQRCPPPTATSVQCVPAPGGEGVPLILHLHHHHRAGGRLVHPGDIPVAGVGGGVPAMEPGSYRHPEMSADGVSAHNGLPDVPKPCCGGGGDGNPCVLGRRQ